MQQQQQFGGRPHPQMTLNNLTGHRTAILLSHPLQMGQLNMGMTMQGSQIPLVNSQSSGNILHVRLLQFPQELPNKRQYSMDVINVPS